MQYILEATSPFDFLTSISFLCLPACLPAWLLKLWEIIKCSANKAKRQIYIQLYILFVNLICCMWRNKRALFLYYLFKIILRLVNCDFWFIHSSSQYLTLHYLQQTFIFILFVCNLSSFFYVYLQRRSVTLIDSFARNLNWDFELVTRYLDFLKALKYSKITT